MRWMHGHRKKTIEEWESECCVSGACVIHPRAQAARKVYQLRHGKITSSKIDVCHTCDHPGCIVDSHHFLGTCKDNMIDASKKGRLSRSVETRKKMSKPKSEITKQRMRIAQLSRPDEVSFKIGLAQRGKILSPDHRQKLSIAHIGKVLSVDHKNKVSESMKKFHEDQHATGEPVAFPGGKMRCYCVKIVKTGEIRAWVGTHGEGNAAKKSILETEELKRSQVEVELVDFPTDKETLIAFLNANCTNPATPDEEEE